MELLLGCGSSRAKKLASPDRPDWSDLVTLDFADTHKPDVVHDIAVLPLPFPDNSADEIHAYEVMEHVGQQGDWRFFFDQWSDIWRILKHGGRFYGTSPHWSSPWTWMDPGHTRAFGPEMFTFLSQPNYDKQVGVTPMTDYRFIFKADFDIIYLHINEIKQFEYVIEAVKPSRCTK